MSNFRLGAMACLVAGLAMASSAHAYSTWDFASQTLTSSTAVAPSKSGDPSGYLSGFYAANGVNDAGFATSSAKWSAGTLTNQGSYGQGMCSDPDATKVNNVFTTCGVPNHAIDNKGNTEAAVVKFATGANGVNATPTKLTSITLGYVDDNNSATNPSSSDKVDISIFAWTGGASGPTMTGISATTMDGWTLVGNYANMGLGVNTVNTGGLSSSWWLISAYNSAWLGTAANGNASKNFGGTADQGDDFFKLLAVSNVPAAVPEPGSLALVGLAMFGLYSSRRSKSKKV